MRYLKLFNNKKENIDNQFTDISCGEYVSQTIIKNHLSSENFTSNEHKIISDIFNPINKYILSEIKRNSRINIIFKEHYKIISIDIDKMSDEWYFITYTKNQNIKGVIGGFLKYRKCDGIDGLINCLKDILS